MSKLLDNVNSTTQGQPVSSNGSQLTLSVWADDFDGGTVSIEVSPDNGSTFIPWSIESGTLANFTSNTSINIGVIGIGLLIRAVFTEGAQSSEVPSNVNAQIF